MVDSWSDPSAWWRRAINPAPAAPAQAQYGFADQFAQLAPTTQAHIDTTLPSTAGQTPVRDTTSAWAQNWATQAQHATHAAQQAPPPASGPAFATFQGDAQWRGIPSWLVGSSWSTRDPRAVWQPGQQMVAGFALPVGYVGREDTRRFEFNGQPIESGASRYWRRVYDAMGLGKDRDTAMREALDRLRAENGGTLAGTGFQESGAPAAAPGQPASPGGAPVVAPMGAGVVTGANAAGGAQTATPGGNGWDVFDVARNINTPEGQAEVVRLMMRQANISPTSLNSVARRLRARLEKLVPNVATLSGMGAGFDPANAGAYAASLPGVFQKLAGAIRQPGGDFAQQLAGIGQGALGAGQDIWSGLTPEGAAGLIQQAQALQTLFANPNVAESMGNQLDMALDPLAGQAFTDPGSVETGLPIYQAIQKRLGPTYGFPRG